MRVEVFLYILVMAAVTYFIRMLPLTLIRRKITNRTLRTVTAPPSGKTVLRNSRATSSGYPLARMSGRTSARDALTALRLACAAAF